MRVLFLTFMMFSCISAKPLTPDHPNPKLKADMSFRVNDSKSYAGIAVLDRKTTHKISVDLPKDTFQIFFNTCGREDEFKNPKGPVFEYRYTPAFGKENMGSCALLITAVTRKGEYHRGIIDFVNRTGRDLKAEIFCNGRWQKAESSYLCQTRASIPTGIRFEEETVSVSANREHCDELRPLCGFNRKCSSSEKVLEYEVYTGKGFCAYTFMSKGRNKFRLSTLGYTSILKFPTEEN